MLEVRDLSASYGGPPVVQDVNLMVGRGEVVTLLGANGAGKTTTLHTIIGVLKPLSGTITFEGGRIDGLPPHKIVEAGISLIPEGRRILPFMTVKENLLLGAFTPRAWGKRHDTLELVYNIFPRLKERESFLAKQLSGGERQMVAIARGLMSVPKLLMLDEPSLGLDPKVLTEVYESIKRLRDEGITILLAEQNAHMALKVADRGYVLQTGRITLEGTSEYLLKSDLVRRAYIGR